MYYLRLLFLTFVLSSTGIFPEARAGDRTHRVRDIVGRCEISRHITQEEAEQKALQAAKTEALRSAGIPERLWTVTGLISEDDGSGFNQVLSRMTTLQMDGLVSVRRVEYSEETENGRRYAVATIDADVRSGKEPDPTFILDIDGVDGIYSEGSALGFKATIYGHDAYLHIFWFDRNGGSVIFPSSYEKKRIFIKENGYVFPLDDRIQYLMERIDRTREFETINLIAVATKRDIPFLEDEITFESVLEWIFNIPADERTAWREAVVIQ